MSGVGFPCVAEKDRNAGRRQGKAPKPLIRPGQEDQATAEEFEREGMGVAPKE